MRPLWVCPRCGKQFVNRNSYHSCLDWPLDRHFEGKPRARELFEAFRAAVESLGPAVLVSNKTGIGFMTRVRFAGCQTRKDYLRAGVWLKHRAESPRVLRIDQYGPKDFVHTFEVHDLTDIDEEVMALLRDARAVGDQEHEHQRRRYRRAGEATTRRPAHGIRHLLTAPFANIEPPVSGMAPAEEAGMGNQQKFEARIVQGRGGGAFVPVPFSVPEVFGTRGQVRVKGTIDGHPFKSSIAPMGGDTHLLGLHKATRETIGKSIGDMVRIVLEADTEERTVVVPEDFRRALAKDRKAQETFEKFAFTHRKEYVQWIESAKKPETRERRIAEAVTRIGKGTKFS